MAIVPDLSGPTARTDSTLAAYNDENNLGDGLITVSGGDAGEAVTLTGGGDDTNVDIELVPKGTGKIRAVNRLNLKSGSASDLALSIHGVNNVGLYYGVATNQYLGLVSGGYDQVRAYTPGGAAINHIGMYGSITGASVRLQAAGVDTDIGLALVAKGTGALSSAFPDSTATGGNPRGTYSVDWQSSRASAGRVASGNEAVISGGGNNTASGAQSWVPGGQYADTRSLIGRASWASGRFSSPGDAQSGEMVLRRQTTDATPTILTSDNAAAGTTNQYVIPDNCAVALRVSIVARNTTSNTKGLWAFDVLMRRDAGVATVAIGTLPAAAAAAPYITAGAVAGTVTLSADTTNGALSVSVTGTAATNISWVARISAVEVVAS